MNVFAVYFTTVETLPYTLRIEQNLETFNLVFFIFIALKKTATYVLVRLSF